MALRHLSLRDFVIVAALDLALADGFTALTGETGAGKSILIDALQLVLGGRGDALWVREGQPRCDIAAEFELPDAARPWLAEHGFDTDADALLLRRTIDAAGKSRAWINGSPATLAQLRTLGEWLVDIHGQHAWQSLTRPAAVRALLDAYAGIDTRPLTTAWQAWRQADTALQAARSAQEQLAQERERLLWQIGELDKLAPGEGEWDELNQRHARLSHAQALIDAAQAALAALEGDDGDGGALPALGHAHDALAARRDIEPEFATLAQQLDDAIAQARDAAHSLHGYLRRANLDPEQLLALDQRLGQWLGLARRFRRPPQELHTVLAQWRTELAQLDAAADLAQLQARADAAQQTYRQSADAVSRQRRQTAPQLAAAVTEAMQLLGMAGGRFEVQLQALAEPAPHGLENVAFLVAAHAGSAPRAIERVASGGELSRLALAIAVTTSQLGTAGTLVFDEVDAGVGGAVAATVGRLLQRLGRDRQVLCVTHLPQVAACADAHLQVSKQTGDGLPTSQVAPLVGEARTREIARMLGGEQLSDTTLAHAREMLALPAQPPGAAARPRKVRA
ncbi:MAG TPA: DNA repair protein RecN [Ottowia sp.]|uniref:DNA repair protein RecN n=1 Tax=Ottowia sp. TaxID=1898956 RepID=UPI0011DB71C4|nr:DNA repair protein RecN [Ottowia sp.]TXI16178.1 MAG: DNA repair protein RecN [Ottowia sp.]HNR84229.1 DNA repair protein RecN [Ottowia sp.]HNT86051.1 DNA repair protein RecN [Ottowia sp.]HOZ93688.1 DNA repair protein RecN [Ottowia sp.]HQO52205.1 DNA repair protein RecN [Ottowia sp.]